MLGAATAQPVPEGVAQALQGGPTLDVPRGATQRVAALREEAEALPEQAPAPAPEAAAGGDGGLGELLECRYLQYRARGGGLPRGDWIDHVGGSEELSWRRRRGEGRWFHAAQAGPETTGDIPAGERRDQMDTLALWREAFLHQRDAFPPSDEPNRLDADEHGDPAPRVLARRLLGHQPRHGADRRSRSRGMTTIAPSAGGGLLRPARCAPAAASSSPA